jgi:hypothetical protein
MECVVLNVLNKLDLNFTHGELRSDLFNTLKVRKCVNVLNNVNLNFTHL